MDQLDKLPLPALLVFGFTLAVIIGVRHFGLFTGARAAQPSANATTVAAVIVDPTALNRASAAGERLAEEVSDLARTVNSLREEMVITREVNKGRR